jgi:hypothetical protein
MHNRRSRRQVNAAFHDGPTTQVDKVSAGDQAPGRLVRHLVNDVGELVDNLDDARVLEVGVPRRGVLRVVEDFVEQGLRRTI